MFRTVFPSITRSLRLYTHIYPAQKLNQWKCGKHTQKVKIVINDNIIEQITDFKYLGYRISEYKSDLEDKLQTYNKINGAI